MNTSSLSGMMSLDVQLQMPLALTARSGQILQSMDLERKWNYLKSWLLRVCPSVFLFLH